MGNHRKLLAAVLFALVIGTLIIGMGPGYGQHDAERTNDFANVAAEDQNQSEPEPLAKKAATIDPPQAVEKSVPLAVKPTLAKDPGPKAVSMAEAVTIAEKLGKGYAMKAERTERPAVSFKIDVMGIDGIRTNIELAADGKVRQAVNPIPIRGGPGIGGKSGKKPKGN